VHEDEQVRGGVERGVGAERSEGGATGIHVRGGLEDPHGHARHVTLGDPGALAAAERGQLPPLDERIGQPEARIVTRRRVLGPGAATSSARGGTTVAIVRSASVRILAFAMLRSRTCSESPILSAFTSSSTRSGMFSGSTSISTSRVTWSSTPPALRTPSGFPT